MPIKTVLVYLPSERTAPAVLGAAVKIAEPHKAHIVGLHIVAEIPLYGEFPVDISEEFTVEMTRREAQAADAIKKLMEEKLRAASISFEWRCFSAPYAFGADAIVEQAHCADLVISAKPGDDARDQWGDLPDRVILESGRPVLLVPGAAAPPQIGQRVLIAWNDSREASRAAFDSLDLIRNASAVRILTFIDNEDKRPAAEAACANLVASLSRHGITARSDVDYMSRGGAGEAILSRLVDEGCDLLVTGCYSHSKFREMLFGGVTRDILRETSVPTLMSH